MSIFGNPMAEPWSAKRKISLVLYLIFLIASVWACGQSLARTLQTSPWVCYVFALAALATASFCLTLVKASVGRGYVSGRPLKLFVGVVGFVILWFSILMANTHNIYYIMTINNQRQRELADLKNQLELVGTKSVTAFNDAKAKFNGIIEGDIRNMKDEIQNPNNPGHGEFTQSIINRIEQKLGQPIERTSNPPSMGDFSGRRQYGEALASKIREITQIKLATIDSGIDQLRAFLQKEDYQDTQKTIDDLIKHFHTRSDVELTQGLRNGYSMYAKAQEYIDQLFSQPLIRENTVLSITRLPVVPVSIEATDIAYVWGEFLKSGNVNVPRFRWAIFIALILDLACFIFWYFGVLPEEV